MKLTKFGNIDMLNNESLTIGIIEQQTGFTAVTLTQSKEFKTYKGAERFLQLKGYFQKRTHSDHI